MGAPFLGPGTGGLPPAIVELLASTGGPIHIFADVLAADVVLSSVAFTSILAVSKTLPAIDGGSVPLPYCAACFAQVLCLTGASADTVAISLTANPGSSSFEADQVIAASSWATISLAAFAAAVTVRLAPGAIITPTLSGRASVAANITAKSSTLRAVGNPTTLWTVVFPGF